MKAVPACVILFQLFAGAIQDRIRRRIAVGPIVLHYLCPGESLRWVHVEQLRHEVLGALGHVVPPWAREAVPARGRGLQSDALQAVSKA